MGAELFTQIAINSIVFNEIIPDIERKEKERKRNKNKK